MPTHDIIVVGASAGGIESLVTLVRALPADFPAAVFVVVHFPPHSTSFLPRILNRAGTLRATHAQDQAVIQPGHIYVAVPDYHLLVHRGIMQIARSSKENRCRPAIDPLFRSAAIAYGPRVVGVILSGTLGDGSAGLVAVKQRGGVAVVQDPADALFPDMPRNALEYVKADYIVPLTEIAPVLIRLVHTPIAEAQLREALPDEKKEIAIMEADMATMESNEKPGIPSVFGCPDCGGTLWELQEGDLLRFRCRIGHGFSAESLLASQTETLEAALWAALRGLEENAALAHRMATRARGRNLVRLVESFEERAKTAEKQAAILRDVLVNTKAKVPEPLPRPDAPPTK